MKVMADGISFNMIISIAPMLRLTNHYFRYLIRLMSQHVLLYTEMVTTPALLHGNIESLLYFSPKEHPISVQLAGNDPEDLGKCATIVRDYGYDHINLNVGCPSQRIQSTQFGACLMKSPELVAKCVDRMTSLVDIPITVKMRLGLGKTIDVEFLYYFINQVAQAGCQTFIIHARSAVLENWSPKANRSKLPLTYDVVYALQKAFPNISIVLNGGITDFDQTFMHLKQVRGVMLGRAAYKNPYMFANCDRLFYQKEYPSQSREGIADTYLKYIHGVRHKAVPWTVKIKPLMGLYYGQPNAMLWRKKLMSMC